MSYLLSCENKASAQLAFKNFGHGFPACAFHAREYSTLYYCQWNTTMLWGDLSVIQFIRHQHVLTHKWTYKSVLPLQLLVLLLVPVATIAIRGRRRGLTACYEAEHCFRPVCSCVYLHKRRQTILRRKLCNVTVNHTTFIFLIYDFDLSPWEFFSFIDIRNLPVTRKQPCCGWFTLR